MNFCACLFTSAKNRWATSAVSRRFDSAKQLGYQDSTEALTLTVPGTPIAISIEELKADLDIEGHELQNEYHIALIEEGMRQAEADEAIPHEQVVAQMRWQGCDEVEVIPGKVSGVPILVGTRMQAGGVIECYEAGRSAEEIADDFDLDLEQVKAVIDYAVRNGLHNP
jgi:uncharacterized protein (DUF433 family)